jgi:hypothetical protein
MVENRRVAPKGNKSTADLSDALLRSGMRCYRRCRTPKPLCRVPLSQTKCAKNSGHFLLTSASIVNCAVKQGASHLQSLGTRSSCKFKFEPQSDAINALLLGDRHRVFHEYDVSILASKLPLIIAPCDISPLALRVPLLSNPNVRARTRRSLRSQTSSRGPFVPNRTMRARRL